MADHGGDESQAASVRLTNEDFRRLLMTPRASSAAVGHDEPPTPSASASSQHPHPQQDERAELRRKKKSYYAALKKQEDGKLAELAEKYRDRARERRDGNNDDDGAASGGAYAAVAPDVKSGLDAKERRKRLIQESKFLGGDMEHTHLVKGLDYALLQKVRSEIHSREAEQERQMERLVDEDAQEQPEQQPSDEPDFHTPLAKEIFKAIASHASDRIERVEAFAPGRMAYVVELDDDALDSDIPTTLVRSRAEVPDQGHGQATLTTNDIVINKLAQVLSYLRHGARHANKAKKNKDKSVKVVNKPLEDSIYGDIGEYVPSRGTSDRRDADHKEKSKREDKKKVPTYFDKPLEKDKEEAVGAKIKNVALLSKLAAEPEGYAECYPGLREMDDAIEDSDDEADYSKMDIGNKKGPIGRWDFDTQEEYSAYMNQREALPKAAFQYGVKTMDGRKTRKTNKDKNDKAELDREWQQIQNIIHKRKVPREKAPAEEPEFKVPKY